MKKSSTLACAAFLVGSLLLSGCGSSGDSGNANNTESGSMISFVSLYKAAGIERKFTTAFEQESINVADNIIVHHANWLDRTIRMQKKIDQEGAKAIASIKESVRTYVQKNYGDKIQPKMLFWNPELKGFMFDNRPTKFYLLTPDKDGRFDGGSSSLKEMTFPDADSGSHEDLELWGKYRFRLNYGYDEAIVWAVASQDFTLLWSKEQLFIMSGIHDDKKNHNSICIIARPGDIAVGLQNNTFPFKEDMAFELLAAYEAFCNRFLPCYDTREEFFPEVHVDSNDTDKVMVGKAGYLILSSIKKIDSNASYTTYSGDILYTDGKWAGGPARTAYARFYKDGHREYSNDNGTYFKTNDAFWSDFGANISQHEHL